MIKNTLNEGIPRSKSLDRYPTDRLRTLLRQLTFRSQFFHVCFNTNRAFKMIFGDLRSNSLAGEDTSENRSNLLSVLAWSPDHARQLTFRSQTFFITIRLIIMPWTATNSLRVSMCILSHSR